MLAAVAAALLLAACGGSGDDNGTATAASSRLVSVQNVDGAKVLTDSMGRTLYSANVERSGIRCMNGCTSFWQPARASAREARSAARSLDLDLGTVQRPGGESQLTLNHLPLYTFTEESPGQLDGNGFVDHFGGTRFTWAAATTGGAMASSPSSTSPY